MPTTKLQKNVKLEKFRGDAISYLGEFVDENDDPIDITGWIIFFTVKEIIGYPDSEAVISKKVTSHLDPTNGLTEIEIEGSETDDLLGDYYYDFQYVRPSSPENKPKTMFRGIISFVEDVTREVS